MYVPTRITKHQQKNWIAIFFKLIYKKYKINLYTYSRRKKNMAVRISPGRLVTYIF